MRDKVSNPCTTAEKIIAIYILVFVFLKVNGKVTVNGMNGSRHSLNLLCSAFHLGCNFDFSVSFPNILTLPHFHRNYIYIYILILSFILCTKILHILVVLLFLISLYKPWSGDLHVMPVNGV